LLDIYQTDIKNYLTIIFEKICPIYVYIFCASKTYEKFGAGEKLWGPMRSR